MSGKDDSPTERLEVNPDVLFRQVEDELVLVKIASNEIFALNPTGARIWELISDNGDVAATVSLLAEEFEATESELREQVETFVAELQRQGFLLPST
jgi:Coenzyme PQQ synthesis protein D (PqqD)